MKTIFLANIIQSLIIVIETILFVLSAFFGTILLVGQAVCDLLEEIQEDDTETYGEWSAYLGIVGNLIGFFMEIAMLQMEMRNIKHKVQ